MNRLLVQAIVDEKMQGAYVATAPQPVSNAEFMRELRKALRMPIGLPAMAWMVNDGAEFVYCKQDCVEDTEFLECEGNREYPPGAGCLCPINHKKKFTKKGYMCIVIK